MNWELVALGPLAIQIHLATVVPSLFLGTWLISSRRKVASIIAFCSIYLGLMTITAVTAMFHNEP
jgi:uncharacterized membrane protein